MMSTLLKPKAFFAHSPRSESGFVALGAKHAGHPSRFCFADELSARNYERELLNQPFPDGTVPITLVAGVNTLSRTAMIRVLIELRHGEKSPKLLIAHSEDSTRQYLQAADAAGMPYVWFMGDKHHSHALAIFAAANPQTRIYLMGPLFRRPSMSKSIARLSRVICLSA